MYRDNVVMHHIAETRASVSGRVTRISQLAGEVDFIPEAVYLPIAARLFVLLLIRI